MNDPKAILLRILEIIGYSEDKEKFATEFLQNVSSQALLDLFNTLPDDRKGQLQEQIKSAESSPQVLEETLRSHFTQSQIQDALRNASKNAIVEYIKTIDPTLSETQRTNIVNFAKGLNQNNLLVQSTV